MRKLVLILLAALGSSGLSAQNRELPDALHVKLNLMDYGSLAGEDVRLGEGFEVGYFRNIAPFLNVGVPLKLGLAKLPQTSGNTVTTSADLVFHLENMRAGAKVIPYAFGGVGYFLEKFDNGHVQFPFGVGFNFRISQYGFINLQGEFRKALVDERDNLQAGLGFVYLLHKVAPKPADTDKDGTPDVLDKCPTQPGPAVALGCPDADNDGLGNTEDACPNQAGPLETAGCPDQDNDAVADKDDQCPEQAGFAALQGCPDRDQDGFADQNDECPDQPGRWNGCPDTDFDGIADKDDRCPQEAGPAENRGCPQVKDTDGDGTPDDRDLCPDQPGPMRGCPDKDADGVADQDDPCPAVAGAFAGCPDSDGDGIGDHLDKCPATAGPASNSGCPEVKPETKARLAFATQAVQFETAKAKLKQSSYAVLDEIIEIMRQYPDYNLAISGHTDNVGTEETNQQLSEQRAKSCYDYLIFRGIKAERLRHAGFGEERPIATNDSEDGRELNRRVEFELTLE